MVNILEGERKKWLLCLKCKGLAVVIKLQITCIKPAMYIDAEKNFQKALLYSIFLFYCRLTWQNCENPTQN